MSGLIVQIYDGGRFVCEQPLEMRLDIGRQPQPEKNGTPEPVHKCFRVAEGHERINIAQHDELVLSRKPVILQPLPNGRVLITNESPTFQPEVNGVPLKSGEPRIVNPPLRITLANKCVTILAGTDEQESSDLLSLSEPTPPPGSLRQAPSSVKATPGSTLNTQALIERFQAVASVLQCATNSEEFFRQAAKAMVDLVGLDSGRVLLLTDGKWHSAALEPQAQEGSRAESRLPSRSVLNRLLTEKRTFWTVPEEQLARASRTQSLDNIETVVAAPILQRDGEVIGALYGDRKMKTLMNARPVDRLDAALVETLACGVASGLALIDQQRAAVAAEERFAQFFTPELSRHLVANPDMLAGRDTEVTLMFCDIRGFSRISERLSPEVTMEWIGEVMSVLTDCVVAQQGVIVDYIGDELMAMWGAPADQPNHPQLACRAASQMMNAVSQLGPQWQDRLGELFSVGIGLNTGPAFVGNTGSRRKFKYGPLGNSVNVASRVQGATKYLRSYTIITASTQARLGDEFVTRRLRQVRVINIQEPLSLFELAFEPSADWKKLRDQYEKALTDFEASRFNQCASSLGRVLGEYPDDGPSLILLSHATQALVNPQSHLGPVWELPLK